MAAGIIGIRHAAYLLLVAGAGIQARGRRGSAPWAKDEQLAVPPVPLASARPMRAPSRASTVTAAQRPVHPRARRRPPGASPCDSESKAPRPRAVGAAGTGMLGLDWEPTGPARAMELTKRGWSARGPDSRPSRRSPLRAPRSASTRTRQRRCRGHAGGRACASGPLRFAPASCSEGRPPAAIRSLTQKENSGQAHHPPSLFLRVGTCLSPPNHAHSDRILLSCDSL
jgi:hypothetical protein